MQTTFQWNVESIFQKKEFLVAAARKKPSKRAACKITFRLRDASGHDFSRAADGPILILALAAENYKHLKINDAGAKARHLVVDLPARLKSCPDASCLSQSNFASGSNATELFGSIDVQFTRSLNFAR